MRQLNQVSLLLRPSPPPVAIWHPNGAETCSILRAPDVQKGQQEDDFHTKGLNQSKFFHSNTEKRQREQFLKVCLGRLLGISNKKTGFH